ncbi:hypothetical protein TL16_g02029 [Triparma laevis f. inornata]|uniref:Uncharacterized protein n=2 Tax=Triparma laevis TaxID=1534972 RepID=A0A9W7FPW1_9STRA|nr:hypothetical protein TL16_g02029 [Triparma laevis f. inornata]GMI16093.1 hypothetical protein TrLO_g4823 [Triparma laevis f. longispina]
MFAFFERIAARHPPTFRAPWGTFIAKEISRPGFKEFFAGGIFAFLVCGVGVQATITDEDRKGSKYYQQFVMGKK